MIRCRVAQRRIEAAAERVLPLEQRFELEAHTAQCPACAAREREARRLQEWLEGPGDPPPTLPDVDAAARVVFARLERGEGRPWRARRPRRAALVLGATLVLAASVTLAFALRTRRGSERVEAAPPGSSPAPATSSWTATSVEVAVRGALLASFASAGADEERARQRYLELVREPARAGWPVRRFVEGLLENPDANVALAAVRCLGTLGEASAAPALERALERPELAEEAFATLGALAQLGEAGEPALAVLERALSVPERAPRALRELCRVGGERPARSIERAAELARDDSKPSRAALLDALTSTGPAAVASLLRLAAREGEREASTAILARLPLVAESGPELVHVLERERLPGDLAYRALLVLQPVEALPWLEERCAQSRERALALETLASYTGDAPLASTLRLAQGGRVPREDVLVLLRRLFERNAERAETFTATLAKFGEAASIHAWLALLIESEHASAARALVPLVFCTALPDDDRQWAALAVGELGTEDDAAQLERELAGCLAGDRRLSAACLLTIHARLGAPGVERLLAACSPASVRRVVAALESPGRSGEAVLVHRVARALDGALAERSETPVADKEFL